MASAHIELDSAHDLDLPDYGSGWAADPAAFDVNVVDDRFIENPFPTYARLRDEDPVHRNPDGTFLLTRYTDVKSLLSLKTTSNSKDDLFAAKYGQSDIYEHFTSSMVFKDPPHHGAIRRTVSRAFTPGALASFEGEVNTVIEELVGSLRDRRQFDFVGDFSYILPMSVIAAMLGVSTTDRDLFVRWSTAVSQSLETVLPEEDLRNADDAAREMKEYFRDLIAARRKKPGVDLLSMLIAGEEADDRITEIDLLHNAAFLLEAGHETTSSLISGGLVALKKFPDQERLLVADPGLADTAIEEFLRYDSPNQLGGRMPLEDTTFGERVLPAGTFIWISNGAANHDPRQFRDPARLDIRRNPNPHVAFGHGLHLCLGASLARLEARCAFRLLAPLLPKLRLAGTPVRRRRARHRGFTTVPVTLDG